MRGVVGRCALTEVGIWAIVYRQRLLGTRRKLDDQLPMDDQIVS